MVVLYRLAVTTRTWVIDSDVTYGNYHRQVRTLGRYVLREEKDVLVASYP